MDCAFDGPAEAPMPGSPRRVLPAWARPVGELLPATRRAAALALLSLACLGLGSACSKTTSSPNPRTALDRYTTALRDGRTREAYALLSSQAKRSMSLEAFERMVQENPAEVRALVEALERPTAPPYVTAQVTAPDGETLLLVYEDGSWRIDASAVDLYGQTTPEQTVRSFVRAFQSRRYDVLLRFVPDAHREGLDVEKLKEAWEGDQKDEMTQLVAALTAGLTETQVELLGDRATVAYGSGGTVDLVREHGLWKIEDFR